MPSLDILIPLFVILILSLSFHEAAHAWAADRLGDPTARMLGRLTLNPLAHIDWIGTVLFPLISMMTRAPLLGWAKPVPVNLQNLRSPLRDFAIVAAAGPASNLVLATGIGVIFFLVHPGGVDPYSFNRVSQVLYLAILTNVVLAVFNMLPIPPLDGSKFLMYFGAMTEETYMRISMFGGFLLLLLINIPACRAFLSMLMDGALIPFALAIEAFA